MANRRMFSLKIVDTDAFLEMPISSQLLYFHLSMRADDEGFVGSPKKIIKMIGSNDDDLKILFVKRFILSFESGVIVIKHWLIHNSIRMDRFAETTYKDERKLLKIKRNSSYTEATKWQPNGNQWLPQVKLSKVKLSKVKLDSVEQSSTQEKPLIEEKKKQDPLEKIDLMNEIEKYIASPQKHIHIAGLWLKKHPPVESTRAALDSQLSRNLRPAKALIGYTDKRIIDAIDWVGYDGQKQKYDPTLETVLKKIDII